ncbi:MAG TPA: hypothetical protein VMN03_13015, partial [Burkholderiales bacterium]|nr:hypothetical protein [Burkholderiales bacterium]
MTVPGLLSKLRQLDIQLRMEGDELLCNARAGVLTPELRDQLRRQKSDIVKFLRSTQALVAPQCALVPLQQNGTEVP